MVSLTPTRQAALIRWLRCGKKEVDFVFGLAFN